MPQVILAIDQGTTGTTVFVVDGRGRIRGREFHAPVSREPVLGRRLIRGCAFECISRLAIFSLALVLAAGAWSCSSEPPMHGAVGTPHVVGMPGPVPVSPSATPQPTPSQ